MVSRTLFSVVVEGRASVWRDGTARMSPSSQLLYWNFLVCSQELLCYILSRPCFAWPYHCVGRSPSEWAAPAHKSLCLHTIQALPFLKAESGCREMDESHFPSVSNHFISGKQMCSVWWMHLGDCVPGVRSLCLQPSRLFTALLIICSVSMGSGSLVEGNLPSWDLVQWLRQPHETKPNLHAWVQDIRHSKKFW